MNRIICYGDTHQNIKAQKRILNRKDYDLALCLGDIEMFRDNDRPIYYICLSENTLVLTEEGWKNYTEINLQDKVLSLNEDRTVEWSEIKDIQIYHHQGKMVNIQSTLQNQLITPEHRVLYHTPYSGTAGNIKFKKGKEILNKTHLRIPVAGTLEKRKDANLSDDLIKLLAWTVSEGSYTENSGVYIYQNEGENFKSIKNILDNLNLRYSISSGRKDYKKRFYIFKNSSQLIKEWLPEKTEISKLIENFSVSQIKVFLKEFIKGDGHLYGKGHSFCLYTSKKKLTKQLVTLCSLVGWRSKISSRTRETNFKKECTTYRISVCKHNFSEVNLFNKNNSVDLVDYNGFVFDLTTEKGNFLAMRNGKPFFTGNSGNHDKDKFPELLRNLRWGHVQLDNFNYLNNGATYDYKGMKIVGISGNYAPTDYDKKRKNLKNQRHFTKEEVEHTKNIPFNIYFLLSHETPLGYADKKGNKNLGVEPITDIMKTLEPKFHLTGHTHIQQMDKYKETYIINCGYGVNGEFVIIDLDNNKVEFYKEFELSDIKKVD